MSESTKRNLIAQAKAGRREYPALLAQEAND